MNRYLLAALVLAATATNLHPCSAGQWKPTKPKPKPKPALCYDCDYDPDDAQVGKDKPGEKGDGWAGYGSGTTTKAAAGGSTTKDSRRGFPRCALDSGDERFVRLTECHSNVCFIRRDHNGLVYRGCADPRNLPLDIDSSVQCREQGRLPAVWWFCNGTLCNSEQFSTVCGADSSNGNSGNLCVPHATNAVVGYPPKKPSPVPPHQPKLTYEQATQPAGYGSQRRFQSAEGAGYDEKPSPPSYPPPSQTEPSGYGAASSTGGGAPWSYDDQDDAEKSAHQSGQSSADGDDDAAYRTWDFLLLAKSRLQRLRDSVDWASSSSDSDDWSTTGQNNGGGYHSNDNKADADPTSGYGTTNGLGDDTNPCDHKCVGNPSALFADPSRPDGFIQCGPGVDYDAGLVCHCCLPYRLTCPSGTHFDDVAKACTNGKTLVAGAQNANQLEYEHVH